MIASVKVLLWMIIHTHLPLPTQCLYSVKVSLEFTSDTLSVISQTEEQHVTLIPQNASELL